MTNGQFRKILEIFRQTGKKYNKDTDNIDTFIRRYSRQLCFQDQSLLPKRNGKRSSGYLEGSNMYID